jgi:hypothetical protein
MFDLAKSDVFKEGDVIVTFKEGDDETKTKIIRTMSDLGLQQWAYSKRVDDGCEQYLFVSDYDQRKEDHLRSCMNSLFLPDDVKAKLSELAV